LIRGMSKKMSFEDRFARKYQCNSYRFVTSMKKENNTHFRNLLKEELRHQLEEEGEGKI